MCDSTLFRKSGFTFPREIDLHKRRVEIKKMEINARRLEVRQLILTAQGINTCGAPEEFTAQALQEKGSIGVRVVHVC